MRNPSLLQAFGPVYAKECRSLAHAGLLQVSNAVNAAAVWVYWEGTLLQEYMHVTHVLDIPHLHMCLAYAAVTLLSTLFSALYHASGEQRFLALDVLFAHLSILANFTLVALIPWNRFVIAGAIFAISSLYFFKNPFNNYVYSHSCWHALVGIANTCFAIGFTRSVHSSPYPYSPMYTGHK
jgi:hypothetical protein